MRVFKKVMVNLVILGILFGAYSICFRGRAVETFSKDSAGGALTVYVCGDQNQTMLAKDIDISGGRVIFLTQDEFNDVLKNKLRIIAKNGYNIKYLS